MASTSPYAPRLIPVATRTVSVNMEYTDPGSGSMSNGSNHEQPPPIIEEPSLDMDIMHDFGEGVGVDMRDFPSHSGDEDHEVMIDPLGEDIKHNTVQSHMTPTLASAAPITPQPPTSASTNGLEPPSSSGIDDMFKAETGLDGDDDDDDAEDPDGTPHAKRARTNDTPGGFTFVDKDGAESGRRKIRIEYIADKSRRHITFSKRKAGIMKKAYELSILTGTQVLLLVVSETGLVYTFTTSKLQPLVQKAEGKNLIQACLNAPDGFGPDGQPLGGPVPATKAKNGGLAIRPHKLTASASAALAASAQAASMAQHNSSGDEHAQAQSDALAHVGQGTPSTARPKKRMPSGKAKKGTAQSEMGNELVPPVPPLPDMHRSPGSQHMISQPLTSPLSAGYHMPPEYHHHHQPSPTHPNFGYVNGPDYGPGGYYAPPPPPPPHGGDQHYLSVQQHQQQHMQYQHEHEQRERARMMMDQGGQMGMGM